MFGHSEDRGHRNNDAAMPDGILNSDDNTTSNALIGDMTSGKYPPTDLPAPSSAPATPVDDTAAAVSSFGMGPAVSSAPLAPSVSTVSSPSVDPLSLGMAAATPLTPPDAPANADELLDIKQQVLQQLSPLVDHLEQSPSDRFRTTMMMIQASDNATLIKSAYDAAAQIADDKERAQALLDLVNEINYFTQKNKGTAA
jgi:hypothetical protein